MLEKTRFPLSEVGPRAWGDLLADEIARTRGQLCETPEFRGEVGPTAEDRARMVKAVDCFIRLRELEASVRGFVQSFEDGAFNANQF